MFTVMLWRTKGELRVVKSNPPTLSAEDPWFNYKVKRAAELDYLPEHREKPPQFVSEAEAWQYIASNYPHLHP